MGDFYFYQSNILFLHSISEKKVGDVLAFDPMKEIFMRPTY